MSIKTIVTAAAIIISTTATAQACGFVKKAIYGGACSQAEYEVNQKAKAADKFSSGDEEGFYMSGNYAYVDLGEGNVVMMTKQDVITAYKHGKEDGVIDLIGKTINDDLKNDPNFSINPDEDWGEVVGKDSHGNLLDEKSISDFRDGLKDVDTSALSTADIVGIINEDVVTVLHEGSLMVFESSDAANAHFGAVDPEVHNE